jgi:hypothetical protein
MRSEHDENILDRARANHLEHGLEQQLLLGRAEARRGARGEDDDGDVGYG